MNPLELLILIILILTVVPALLHALVVLIGIIAAVTFDIIGYRRSKNRNPR